MTYPKVFRALFLPRLRLRNRMTVFLGLFLLVLMLVVTLISAQREKDLLTQQIKDEGIALAHAYALSAENALILKGAGLARVVGEAGRIPEIVFISIVDPQRKILAHSDPDRIGEKVDDATIDMALETSIGAVDAGRTPFVASSRSALGREVLVVVVPLVILDQVKGAIEIGLGTELISQAAESSSRSSFLITVTAFLFGVAFIVLFSRSVTRPLVGLSQAADRIRAGTWTSPIPIPGDGEFSQLAQAMETMRQEVSTSFSQLAVRSAEVEELRRYAENILDSLQAGVVSLDLGGRIRGMNRQALLMVNRTRTAAGCLPSDVLAPWPPLAQAFGEVALDEGLHREVQEGQRLLRLSATSLREAGGAVIGRLVVMEDITFLRSMEIRMQDAEKMSAMGELAAGVAHEVRNPLGSIRNAAQFLDGKWSEDDTRGRFTKLIIEEVDRLNSLVNRLLQYTKSENTGLEPHRLTESVEQALVLAELRVGTNRIVLRKAFPSSVPPVLASPRRIVQMMLNLLFNAMEAIPQRGTITVGIESRRGEVVVLVSDTGSGMNAETLARAGEPFFTTRETGTGLGLTIARQIAAEHRAQMVFESVEGRGTTVSVAFPVEGEQDEESA